MNDGVLCYVKNKKKIVNKIVYKLFLYNMGYSATHRHLHFHFARVSVILYTQVEETVQNTKLHHDGIQHPLK